MTRFGGFGGGANMQQLMKQAQKMQEDALRAKQEIAETELEGQAQGGLVKVTITGDKQPVSVSINPQVVDPDDTEMLEDLVLVALRDATEKADKLNADKMGAFGGLL
jgi:hypothetical protein